MATLRHQLTPHCIRHAPRGDREKAKDILGVLGAILLLLESSHHKVGGCADQGASSSQHGGKGHGDEQLLGTDAAPIGGETRHANRTQVCLFLRQGPEPCHVAVFM